MINYINSINYGRGGYRYDHMIYLNRKEVGQVMKDTQMMSPEAKHPNFLNGIWPDEDTTLDRLGETLNKLIREKQKASEKNSE